MPWCSLQEGSAPPPASTFIHICAFANICPYLPIFVHSCPYLSVFPAHSSVKILHNQPFSLAHHPSFSFPEQLQSQSCCTLIQIQIQKQKQINTNTNPEIVDVIPAVFEPAREEPDISVTLGHSQAVRLDTVQVNFPSIYIFYVVDQVKHTRCSMILTWHIM